MRSDHDVIVSGGGVAGLVAAAVFGTAGFSVLCIDPAPPVTDAAVAGADLRSTAFLQPAVALLRQSGLWDRLEPEATALRVMRLVDAAGPGGAARLTRDFDAADISDAPFGYNLPNWLLRRQMLAQFADLPGVEFRPGVATLGVLTRAAEVQVGLSDGSRAAARLLIAADGRDSAVRRALGIGVRRTGYGQQALAFAVTHPIPHQNVSTEIHRAGGPFTLVPLPDRDGRPASAVVWMESGPRATALAALPVAEFEAAMSERSCHLFGPLTLASRRTLWPIISQIADRFTAERTALIAEAAHVAPPIGAQGLNMSLGDTALLLDLAVADPGGLGSTAMLDTYQRRRWPQVAARLAGIDALNRVAMAGAPLVQDLRAAALKALHGVPPVRRGLMQLGLGLRA